MRTLAKMVSEITKDQMKDMEDRVEDKFDGIHEAVTKISKNAAEMKAETESVRRDMGKHRQSQSGANQHAAHLHDVRNGSNVLVNERRKQERQGPYKTGHDESSERKRLQGIK